MPVIYDSFGNVASGFTLDGDGNDTMAAAESGGLMLMPTGKTMPWYGWTGQWEGAGGLAGILKHNVAAGRKDWQPGAEINFTEDGFAELTEAYETEWNCDSDGNPTWSLLDALPQKFAPHPVLKLLGLESIRVRHKEPDSALVTLQYVGMAGQKPWPPHEEVITNTSQENIETHPSFKRWTGLPSAPKPYVIIDDENKFIGFRHNAPNDLGGVTDWLVRNTVIRRSYASPTRPTTLKDVGRIYILQDAPLDVPSWLKISKVWRRRGNAWAVAEDYMASGPKSWNAAIYGALA